MFVKNRRAGAACARSVATAPGMLKTPRAIPLLCALLLFGCATPPAPQPSPTPAERTPDAPTPPPVQKEAPATQEAPAAKIDDSNSIYFTLGATDVDLPGQQKLRAHAQRLQANPELVVTLIGHTDNLGSRAYNMAIAEKRIEGVSALLRSYGVAKKQIRRYAVGSEHLDRSCKTAACRQKMRRVELSYPK